jgi:hypothetical protein
MVLVSYPESGILGGICRLGELWEALRGGNRKAGHCPLARQVSLFLFAVQGIRTPR